jgi:glycine/D-amino acid oxidase-like deaminating enzyme
MKRSLPSDNTRWNGLIYRKHETGDAVVVVGASLSGLMSALALSRIGMTVTMLERSDRKARAGAASPVSEGLLQRLTDRNLGRDALPSGPQAWADVHASLRAVVDANPNIQVRARPREGLLIRMSSRHGW